MPTSTPPPYFPQNSLLPPDENRARKIKLAVGGCLVLLLLLIAGAIYGVVHLIRA
ncbi:MAG: hypothetical protein QOG00_1802 [Pyrinomonadaceae bacterium]|nr:hypothetical protein [Pyrinomonadaceae bacterium]MDQ1611871.1 hypothetical protein [Pyrinomonadaceae bacterium]MDX6271620.1 hypothetical protein [Acidobacteriota bacterium]